MKKLYKVKRLPNIHITQAQIIRISDNKEMLDQPMYLACVKRMTKKLNEGKDPKDYWG